MDKVQCKSCGLLAVRRQTDRELMEVEEEYRDSGTLHASAMNLIHPQPVCFARAANLHHEAECITGGLVLAG